MKKFVSALKVSTFFKIEITILFIISLILGIYSYNTFKSTIDSVQTTSKNVIMAEDQALQMYLSLDKYLVYDATSFRNDSKSTIKEYDSVTNNFRNSITKLTNDKGIDTILDTKKIIFNKYITVINSKEPKHRLYKQISYNQYTPVKKKVLLVINSVSVDTTTVHKKIVDSVAMSNRVIYYQNVKDKKIREIYYDRMNTNIVLTTFMHKHLDDYIAKNQQSINDMEKNISAKFRTLAIVYFISIPIFILSLILLIYDIGKLFRRDTVKESFIETLIRLKNEGH